MTSESDERFIDRMEHDWVHDIIPNGDDAHRLFALARRGAAVQWRPIEEAPKDGRPILLYWNNVIYCGRWRDGSLGEPQQDEYAWRCDSSGRFANPTHFMPLPPLPTGETDDD